MNDLLATTLMAAHPEDAAQALEPLSGAELAAFLQTVSDRSAAKVLGSLSPLKQADCVSALSDGKVVALLTYLPTHLSAQLLRQIDKPRRQALMQALPLTVSAALALLQRYPKGSVGALMDPLSPTLPQGINVEVALKRLRERNQSIPHVIYVVDGERRLLGRISASHLLLANRRARVDSLIDREGPSFSAQVPFKDLDQHPVWINETLIPVIDRKGVFVGALSQDKLSAGQQHPPASSPGSSGNAFLDLADLLWTLLGALFNAPPKGQPPSPESHREH